MMTKKKNIITSIIVKPRTGNIQKKPMPQPPGPHIPGPQLPLALAPEKMIISPKPNTISSPSRIASRANGFQFVLLFMRIPLRFSSILLRLSSVLLRLSSILPRGSVGLRLHILRHAGYHLLGHTLPLVRG